MDHGVASEVNEPFLGDHAVLQVRARHPPLGDGAEPHRHRADHRQLQRQNSILVQVQRVRDAAQGHHELQQGAD